MKEHPYAEILHAIADGKQIQYRDDLGRWVNAHERAIITELHNRRDLDRYRVKPPVIVINGIEVPEPLRELPEKMNGMVLYHPAFLAGRLELESMLVGQTIAGSVFSNNLLRLGILHKTFDAALAHAKALISFSAIADIDANLAVIPKVTEQEKTA